MNNIIFIFTSLSFFIWVIRNTFYWVYLWQLKEYRLDRVLIHFKETYQGKRILLSPFLWIKILLIIGYGYIVFNNEYLLFYQIFISLIFYYEAFSVLQEIIFHRLRRPSSTIKGVIMCSLTIFFISILFTIPFVDKYLWLLLLECLIPFIIYIIVFAFSFPTEIYHDYKIEKARKKLADHKKILVIAITGSYGKSSTKEFVSQILEKKFRLLKTQGSNNTPIGIANTILDGLKNNTEILVTEMGAYKKGEILELCEIVNPEIGIITGINDQHLSLFGSLSNTMQAKYELIDSLPKNGLALFNGNNNNAKKLYEKTKINKVLYEVKFSVNDVKRNIFAENIVTKKNSVSFDVILKRKKIHFEAPVIGAHNIENILPGIFIGNRLGISDFDLVKSVSSLQSLPKTMTKQELENGTIVIDDTFNTSQQAVRAALSYLKVFKQKRILVFQPMIELGVSAGDEHYRVAGDMVKICDYIFVTNENFLNQMREGASLINSKCEIRKASIVEIAKFIQNKVHKGDVVLFEGKEAGMVLNKIL
ncbi:MAG: UDP-N-acetylmuramoyl-tripeptide--D-alanyl-D-alanine ligase [Candidatus Levybacteria bacterium]|nr:UDP-N-acetylmuramoyl-tripeptide--D-alanyl-D-alanine ligase [Candidatus Levybacteria bacterium]